MPELSEATWEKLRKIFPAELHEEAAQILENEGGNNLPFLEKMDKYGLERFRFAALKLSNGKLDQLRSAVELGKSDWRDLLVSAGVGSIDAHTKWEIKS
jgi:hypothetical protein